MLSKCELILKFGMNQSLILPILSTFVPGSSPVFTNH